MGSAVLTSWSQAMTVAPAWAKASTRAEPMPPPAPVMTTRFPFSPVMTPRLFPQFDLQDRSQQYAVCFSVFLAICNKGVLLSSHLAVRSPGAPSNKEHPDEEAGFRHVACPALARRQGGRLRLCLGPGAGRCAGQYHRW